MAEPKKVTSRSRSTKARKTKSTETTTPTKKATRSKKSTATKTTSSSSSGKKQAATTDVDTPGNITDIARRKWSAKSSATSATSKFNPSELSNIGNFQPLGIQELIPTNLFTDSSSLPYTSPSDYDRDMEQIRGKVRSVQILRENLSVIFQLTQAEGDQIKILTEEQKNQTLSVKLQQAQIDTQIAETNLAGRSIRLQQAEAQNQISDQHLQQTMLDVNGETQVTGLRQESWELKLQGLRLGITEARDKLTKERNRLNESGVPS